VRQHDFNTHVILETLTQYDSQFILAQKYITDIETLGDKRVLLINGEPFPKALSRIPPKGDIRGNLAVGATGIASELTDRDKWICQQVGPVLKEKGLLFAGLDIIGDYLTEINVTSPTCIREIDHLHKTNVSMCFWESISNLLASR